MKYRKPNCIKEIGEEVFLKVPLYKRKNKYKLIYVNPKLFEKYFKTSYTFEKACNYLEEYFSVTINECYKDSNDKLGDAYVDYQSDPTNIALDGNKGSGRAYYIGENFNLKGELTPLATSPFPVYNNGKLSLESAIHETLISNVLGIEFKIPTYQTLAIFDLGETYLFPNSNKEMKCGVMVRVYDDNELYRFSHRFINNKPFTREELYEIATNMGIIEANKFIHRLLHGAWSLGNMSIDTNMIDFDTTYFVQNRNPSYSFTHKYKTNYFGYEDLGELKVLETILDSNLNVDKVLLDELRTLIIKKKDEEMVKEFPRLMGIEIPANKELEKLVNEFTKLSRYMFKAYEELNTMNPNNNEIALFNFSNLFRYYPKQVKDNTYSINKCLDLILNGNGDILETDNKELKDIIESYFSNYQVESDEKFLKLINEVIQFIIDYNKLFRQFVTDIDDAIKNAYIINEDRNYLFNNAYLKYHLAHLYNGENNELINNIMNTVIDGSVRDGRVCDLNIVGESATFNTFVGVDLQPRQKKLER